MDYNNRLFKGSRLRSWYHFARFVWLKKELSFQGAKLKVLELGCFDGRSLDYINTEKLNFYHGYDANWEGGLSLARNKQQKSVVKFSECNQASELDVSERFNVFLSLETLEHLDENVLDEYLAEIKKTLDEGAMIIVSVPNELGLLFALKTVLKKVLYGDSEGYSFWEFLFQIMGETEKVQRNQHKGFNWKYLKDKLSKSFNCEFRANGIHFSLLPLFLNPSIGLVGRFKSEKFET